MSAFSNDFEKAFPLLPVGKRPLALQKKLIKKKVSFSDIVTCLGAASAALQAVINLIASLDWSTIGEKAEAAWDAVVAAYNSVVAYFNGNDDPSADSLQARIKTLKSATAAFKRAL